MTCVDCVKQLCGRIVVAMEGPGSAGCWWLDMPKLGITLGPTVVPTYGYAKLRYSPLKQA